MIDRPTIVVHLDGLDWRVDGLTSLRHTPLDEADERRGVVRYVPAKPIEASVPGVVERRHRWAAVLAVFGQVAEFATPIDMWIDGKRFDSILNQQWQAQLDRVAQALASAESTASQASERPVLYRSTLGVVQLVSSESADPIVYRALGPSQRMPREAFLEVFERCEPIDASEQASERDGWVSVEERKPASNQLVQFHVPHINGVCFGYRGADRGPGHEWEDLTQQDACGDCETYSDEQVTDWAMPLQPPTGKGPSK